MDLDDVAALTSPDGRRLLAELPDYAPGDTLTLTDRLRRAGHPPALVAAALTQARLRHAARGRLGDLVDRLLLTPDGAEQVTRPVVAAHRARRYVACGVTRVVDLGAGVGGDAWNLAGAGLDVDAVERDPVTAAVLTANLAALGLADRSQVTVTDARSVDLGADDVVFADPARRAGGRRLTDPQSWSPPLAWLLAGPTRDLGLKVAPGLDHARIPADVEAEYVSVSSTLVELALYRGRLRTPGVVRGATVLVDGAAHRVTDADLPTVPPTGPPTGGFGAWLYEPDPAVIRAGLVAAVGDRLGGWLVDPQLAYLSADAPTTSPFVAAYRIDEVMPFQLKRLRSALRARDVGEVVVKKRGFATDPDRIRDQLGLDRARPNRTVVVLTRIGARPFAVIMATQRRTGPGEPDPGDAP